MIGLLAIVEPYEGTRLVPAHEKTGGILRKTRFDTGKKRSLPYQSGMSLREAVTGTVTGFTLLEDRRKDRQMRIRFICFSIVAAVAFALVPFFGIQQSVSADDAGITAGSVKYIQGGCPGAKDKDVEPERSEEPVTQSAKGPKVQGAGILLAGSYEYEKVGLLIE